MGPRIGVVGTNDLCNKRTMGRYGHWTHSLIARWYADCGTIDEPDKLLHEGYWHEYVDDELIETARHRNAYRHAIDSYVEHLHPLCNKAPEEAWKDDPHYALQRNRLRVSKAIYMQRCLLWM